MERNARSVKAGTGGHSAHDGGDAMVPYRRSLPSSRLLRSFDSEVAGIARERTTVAREFPRDVPSRGETHEDRWR
jgi:hypothetical protein